MKHCVIHFIHKSDERIWWGKNRSLNITVIGRTHLTTGSNGGWSVGPSIFTLRASPHRGLHNQRRLCETRKFATGSHCGACDVTVNICEPFSIEPLPSINPLRAIVRHAITRALDTFLDHNSLSSKIGITTCYLPKTEPS